MRNTAGNTAVAALMVEWQLLLLELHSASCTLPDHRVEDAKGFGSGGERVEGKWARLGKG
jgi:hypothetical protein